VSFGTGFLFLGNRFESDNKGGIIMTESKKTVFLGIAEGQSIEEFEKACAEAFEDARLIKEELLVEQRKRTEWNRSNKAVFLAKTKDQSFEDFKSFCVEQFRDAGLLKEEHSKLSEEELQKAKNRRLYSILEKRLEQKGYKFPKR
jgi:hypothetical protein